MDIIYVVASNEVPEGVGVGASCPGIKVKTPPTSFGRKGAPEPGGSGF